MDVENCFILGAGQGTRMGALGKLWPKILWPVYEKSLLELQMAFARHWGCKKIFVNTHHLSCEVEKFVEERKIKIQILKESPLLGSGGAFLNLKKKVGSGLFLYLNADILYFFNKRFFHSLLKESTHHPIVLAGLQVSKSEGYNQIQVRDGFLKGINQNPQESHYTTYAGVGLINLDLITEGDGPAPFFSSVADWRKYDIPVIIPEEPFEYWDFGTRQRYIDALYGVAEKKEGQLFSFLKEVGALRPEKLGPRSYRGKEGVLNFCQESLEEDFLGDCIIIRPPVGKFRGEGLYCGEKFDPHK